MAKNNNNARLIHVSPGVYTKETDLTYASKSLGITTLGVVGETVKGPAFQPIEVEDWRQFNRYFGGTNPQKMKDSNYPKYELPYIAKSYLKQSNQLQVVRVLGLSGSNAGDAWVITASHTSEEKQSSDDKYVVAVLRSRAHYEKASFSGRTESGKCKTDYEYDNLVFDAKGIKLIASSEFVLNDDCNDPTFTKNNGSFNINPINLGRFTIVVKLQEEYKSSISTESGIECDSNGNPVLDWGDNNYDDPSKYKKYSVSLNPSDKNYIYNVIGGDPENGDAEIYVEELYDVALRQMVDNGELNQIDENVITFPNVKVVPEFEPVNDILTISEKDLSRKELGKRFLFSKNESVENGNPIKVHISQDKGVKWVEQVGQVGHIYRVVSHTDANGKKVYYYGEYVQTIGDMPSGNTPSTDFKYKTEVLKKIEDIIGQENHEPLYDVNTRVFTQAVDVISDNLTYVFKGTDILPVTLDMNNYKEPFRCASTPWVVSEIKGSSEDVELIKLFRFHTISDGNNANQEVKISIVNINPSNGMFDVMVRDFYDSDASQSVLERFRCNLIPGTSDFISLKIGSSDGRYESKSKYITVEVNENDAVQFSTPSGFMGYPIRDYNGSILGAPTCAGTLNKPNLKYNTNIDEDLKINKQFFGLSDLVGIDTDVLKYKGVEAYNNLPSGLTPCFHLDSRIIEGKPDSDGYVNGSGYKQRVTVDGLYGYEWQSVNKGLTTYAGIEPRIGDEEVMINTIYEDIRYRKFTLCFCGGFDGWDFNRGSRSNSDEFRYNKYKGNFNYNSGKGTNFSMLRNPEDYNLEEGRKYLNSDYYAYLGAIRCFANPKDIDINVLATPGIDYVNNKSLTNEVVDMVENERADSIYVVTTPDKPFGSGDTEGEMFTPEEAVWNLEDSDINSNYACSYYPWIKYFDNENNVYIYLPPTKDVVRNFAFTDNTAYPWFVPAGWNRGNIDGISPKKSLKIDEQDTLYSGRLNYVNKFAKEGMRIWGDNNMQRHESQMNKISKRRLLLHIRKLCSIACVSLVFEPNDNTLKKSFESAIKPILDNVMSSRGISDWRLEIDDSTEARDRLELPAKIFIKPTPVAEYIILDFTITPQGTNWDDIV